MPVNHATSRVIVEPGQFETVFRFQVRDVDPVRNDNDDVHIDCIRIQNLGSARNLDIDKVQLFNVEENITATESTQAPGQGEFKSLPCPASAPANGPVAFEAFFPRDDLGTAQTPAFEIPDVGVGPAGSPRTFEVRVKTKDPQLLRDNADNHTLQLQATVQFREPPEADDEESGTVSLTGSQIHRVQNRGINSFQTVNMTEAPAIPIPDPTVQTGSQGIDSGGTPVARFWVCDGQHRFPSRDLVFADANAHDLTLDEIVVRQGPAGTATAQDIAALKLFRSSNSSDTSVLEKTSISGDELTRSGPGVTLEGTGAVISDDACERFTLTALASAMATRGHTFQPLITLVTKEGGNTFGTDLGVAPQLETRESIMIGGGILQIVNRTVPTRGGPFPVEMQTIKFPDGLSEIRVQTQAIQFNPDVIEIDGDRGIEGLNGFQVQSESLEIDNRRGTLRFMLSTTPDAQLSGGTTDVARIWVRPRSAAQPGTETSLLFQVDEVRSLNPDRDVTRQIVLGSGSVTLIDMGDVNLDGQLTVSDVLLLANGIVDHCLDSNGGDIPDEFMGLEQKRTANLTGASPDVEANDVKWCDFLDASDVKALAGQVVGQINDRLTSTAQQPHEPASPGSWWATLIDDLFGRTPARDADLDFQKASGSTSGEDGVWTLRASKTERPVGGLQGRIHFDPDRATVEAIRGIAGYEVLASRVDDEQGEVRFLALAPHGGRNGRHDMIRVETRARNDATLRLSLDHIVDADGTKLDVRLDAPRPVAALDVATLDVERSAGRWTLNVRGQGVQNVAIQGYDLGGQPRFQERAQGSRLQWRALDEQTGRPLANGVYLYRVTVEGVNGETWRSDVRKLVVLR